MTIRFQCTECDSVLKIRDDKAGQAGRCPNCKTAFVIPEPDPAASDPSPVAEGGGDDEDDALAFLMESGSVPDAPEPTTALDDQDETTPAIAAKPVSPEERELHRPPPRVQPESEDTSNAAGALLARSESARAAVVNEEPEDTAPRIDMDEVRQVALRRLLPIGGGVLAVALLCFFLFNSMSDGTQLPSLASVTGTITLDGKPLPGATVRFEPVADINDISKNSIGGSAGRTDDEGYYSLAYAGGHDGAVVGTHTVRINKTDKEGLETLGKKYHLASQIKHEVKAGSNTINLTLTSEPDGPPKAIDPLANPGNVVP
ncbi:MAG: hypothetical protein VX669_09505 [Planctomycetota bacterium]|nr:hypothetical protein [Planctomycetota bacterium]